MSTFKYRLRGLKACGDWAAGRSGGPPAGAALVHENPQALVPPLPLHQVPADFFSGAGADLVHESPLTLVLSFPLHQVPADFFSGAAADLVHVSPLTLVPSFPLHQVPSHFSSGGGAALVHEDPQALVLPFPLHQVPADFFSGGGAALVHVNPQALVPPFPLHQVPGHFSSARGRGGAGLVHESPGLHTQPGAFPILILFILFCRSLVHQELSYLLLEEIFFEVVRLRIILVRGSGLLLELLLAESGTFLELLQPLVIIAAA